ncbi:hypothetical protein HJG60_009945 [Phyllostomus discolor]|uniref:Uncharacterized protein n=1 Tax=Phyllostomus discolor TaxID=89673 RepID=A0A834B958_9CHIR|nr:hypothetical protein HJG60_009945 [Phyllostomus discolor]
MAVIKFTTHGLICKRNLQLRRLLTLGSPSKSNNLMVKVPSLFTWDSAASTVAASFADMETGREVEETVHFRSTTVLGCRSPPQHTGGGVLSVYSLLPLGWKQALGPPALQAPSTIPSAPPPFWRIPPS